MKKYDSFSTLMYALGVAIENEDDPEVKEQLEDLEERLPAKMRKIRELKVQEILSR